jgi:hypothetical protein
MNVLIATPFYNAATYTQYVTSMITTVIVLERKKIKYDICYLPSDTQIFRARNILANEFYERKEMTHLFFIDSDMAWTVEAFLKVLDCEEDLVGANYAQKNAYDQWVSPIKTNAGGKPEINKNGLIECYSIATGFCKISRAVFDALAKRGEAWYFNGKPKLDFFSLIKLPEGRVLGEDSSFCHRWCECGGKSWIVPDCTISHIGYKVYDANYAEFMKQNN